ncbi:MAG: helix-turn-helix transcriptional regulator [Bacteroidota bacterium]
MKKIQKQIAIQSINKSDLAEQIGVSRSILYAWIKGTKVPSVGNLESLLSALGLHLTVVSTSGLQHPDSMLLNEPQEEHGVSTVRSQNVNLQFISKQLEEIKFSMNSTFSNTEKILKLHQLTVDKVQLSEDSQLEVDNLLQVDIHPEVDSIEPEEDSQQQLKKRKQKAKQDTKQKTKKRSNTPSYTCNGIKGSIREHLLRAFPNLSTKEIDRARNNINRRIRGRPDKENARTYPPSEAIALEMEKIKSKK